MARVTDEELIRTRKENFGELNDGLHVFTNQGLRCIDMLVYHGEEDRTHEDHTWKFDYDLYEINIYEAETHLDLTELSQFAKFNDGIDKQYKWSSVEYYDNAQEAHMRLGLLIAELNHF